MDRWARPRPESITLDGVARAVEIAHLDVGERANVRLYIRMLSLQEQRLATFGDRPVAEQIALARDERDANAQLGAWVTEVVATSLRPVAPWTSASGLEVTDGVTYCDAYGNDAILAAFWAIYLRNELDEDTRKNSASPRGSAAGSPPSESPARGDGPANPVDGASPSDSTSPAAVSVTTFPIANPSGTTAAPSRPVSALSAV